MGRGWNFLKMSDRALRCTFGGWKRATLSASRRKIPGYRRFDVGGVSMESDVGEKIFPKKTRSELRRTESIIERRLYVRRNLLTRCVTIFLSTNFGHCVFHRGKINILIKSSLNIYLSLKRLIVSVLSRFQ